MKSKLALRSSPLLLTALLVVPLGCGEGTVTFGGGDDNNNPNAQVTVEGNIDNVSPVSSRGIVAFAYNITDNSDRCPCPPDPSNSSSGKAIMLESGATTFSLSGLKAGPLGVVFLLDKADNAADGQIDPGDPIAILDDIDCDLSDVKGGLTVTLKDVDILFSSAPVVDCTDTSGSPPAAGHARADTITQRRSTTTTTLR